MRRVGVISSYLRFVWIFVGDLRPIDSHGPLEPSSKKMEKGCSIHVYVLHACVLETAELTEL